MQTGHKPQSPGSKSCAWLVHPPHLPPCVEFDALHIMSPDFLVERSEGIFLLNLWLKSYTEYQRFFLLTSWLLSWKSWFIFSWNSTPLPSSVFFLIWPWHAITPFPVYTVSLNKKSIMHQKCCTYLSLSFFLCLPVLLPFFRGHLSSDKVGRRSKTLLESCDFSVNHRNDCSTAILLPFGTLKEHVRLQPCLSHWGRQHLVTFLRVTLWHKYWASYLLLSSVQQVSELIMTIQKFVDVDSGNDSLLASVASVKY